MPRPSAAVTYASILRRDGVLLSFAAAIVGRLSYAMVALALLLTVEEATDSYAVAGTAIGAYALVSFVMPLKARLIDRIGAATVLPILSVGFGVCLMMLAVLAFAGHRTAGAYVALALGAGLFAPPLGPSMRAVWAAITPEPGARRRAYSLDSVVEEVLFAMGPLVVGAILLTASAATATSVAAILNVVGTFAFVASPSARRHGQPNSARPASTRWTGPLARPGFAVLVLILLGVGLGGGPLEVAVIARLDDTGHGDAIAGYLLAALSVGSAIGGLLWGRFVRRHRPQRHLGALITVAAVFGLALVPAEHPIVIGLLLFGAGLAGSPLLITAYVSADELVAESQQREASTWVNTCGNVGGALGAAAAGAIIDRSGPAPAFAAGTAAYTLTLLVVVLLGRRLRPAP